MLRISLLLAGAHALQAPPRQRHTTRLQAAEAALAVDAADGAERPRASRRMGGRSAEALAKRAAKRGRTVEEEEPKENEAREKSARSPSCEDRGAWAREHG